jgi:hypothetical protein
LYKKKKKQFFFEKRTKKLLSVAPSMRLARLGGLHLLGNRAQSRADAKACENRNCKQRHRNFNVDWHPRTG